MARAEFEGERGSYVVQGEEIALIGDQLRDSEPDCLVECTFHYSQRSVCRMSA